MIPCFCTDCNKVQPWVAGLCSVCGRRVYLNRTVYAEHVVEFEVNEDEIVEFKED